MAKFLFLLGGIEKSGESVTHRYIEWTQKLAREGRLVATHKLFDSQGKRLQVEAGRVVDGPFVETKESIGGFYLIEAEDLKEATAIAQECPTVVYQKGWVEVRPVEI